MRFKFRRKERGQEEMIGFALIVILVAVILLVFLGFSLRKNSPSSVQSYEVDSFLQSVLQDTTDCQDNFGYLSIKDLIFSCNRQDNCLDGRPACDVLNSTAEDLLDTSWVVSKDSSIQGYSFIVEANSDSNPSQLLNITKGELTGASKGSSQDFVKSGDLLEIFLKIYY